MTIKREELLTIFKKYAPNEHKEIMSGDKVLMEGHLDFLCSGYTDKESAEKRIREAAEEGLID